MAGIPIDFIQKILDPFLRGHGAVPINETIQGELKNINAAFSKNVHFKITGHEDFRIAIDTDNIDDLKNKMKEVLIPSMLGALDTQVPYTHKVVNLVRGVDSQWVACELKLDGTSTRGKFYHLLNNSRFSLGK